MLNLTGVGMRPLPGESSLSVLMYLGWRNALLPRDLYRLFARGTNILPYASFLNPWTWMEGELAIDNFGITLPTTEEYEAMRQVMACPGEWLSPWLRICPICLEQGYHSFWYQLRELDLCPMHDCRLTTECQSCGCRLPLYHFNGKLFRSPYYCPQCGCPFCGAKPELSMFRAFRKHAAELESRFEALSLVQWARGIKGKDCREICHVYRPILSSTWARRDTKRHLARLCHPLPRAPVRASVPGLDVLRWQIQMYERHWYTFGSIQYTRINQVWKALIRRLYYWIFGKPPTPRFHDVKARFSAQYKHIEIRTWDVRELAYCLFLSHFGTCTNGTDGHLVDHGPTNFPEEDMIFWEKRIPRMTVMYSMLCIFAGLIATLRRMAQTVETLDETNLRQKAHEWGAVYLQCSDKGFYTGVGVVPSLDGYPVKWSAAIKAAYVSRSPELIAAALGKSNYGE